MSKGNEHPEMPPRAPALIDSDVLDRSVITVPAKDWKAFNAWIDRKTRQNVIWLDQHFNFLA